MIKRESLRRSCELEARAYVRRWDMHEEDRHQRADRGQRHCPIHQVVNKMGSYRMNVSSIRASMAIELRDPSPGGVANRLILVQSDSNWITSRRPSAYWRSSPFRSGRQARGMALCLQ